MVVGGCRDQSVQVREQWAEICIETKVGMALNTLLFNVEQQPLLDNVEWMRDDSETPGRPKKKIQGFATGSYTQGPSGRLIDHSRLQFWWRVQYKRGIMRGGLRRLSAI
jgi:hypothetical protein